MTNSYGDATVEEPRQIAVEQMRQVAVEAGIEPNAFDSTFHADAQAMLWRPSGVRTGVDALGVVHKLFRLHDAFCRVNGLSGPAAAEHRRAVRSRLSRNLLGLSRSSMRAGDLTCSAYYLGAAVLSRAEILLRRGREVAG